MSEDAVKQMTVGYEAIRGPMNPRPEEKKVCIWSQEDWDCDGWDTSCGRMFSLNEGLPSDNDMKFCCFCGAHLEEHLYEKKDDDEEEADQGS